MPQEKHLPSISVNGQRVDAHASNSGVEQGRSEERTKESRLRPLSHHHENDHQVRG